MAMGGSRHWNEEAQKLWDSGRKVEAVQASLAALDASQSPPPAALLQAAYYLFALGDFTAAAHVLGKASELHPDHLEIALNRGVALSRAGDHRNAIDVLELYLARSGSEPSALDALCASSHKLGDDAKALDYGTRALAVKDERTAAQRGAVPLHHVPDGDTRPNVISFSLWGSNPRYLRGALHNVLAARRVYPEWTCRFIVEPSLDAALLDALRSEGADVRVDETTDDQHRLTRRFAVADDPAVGRFLVRDCDSVVSDREAAAVAQWVTSGLPFHVMRDWWSHTDLILAGLWGGIVGVFPNMVRAIAGFRSPWLATANWDQWFLGQTVWPAIRDQALIHDRLFASYNARPFPGPEPQGNVHVGQDEFTARNAEQAALLQPYARRLPALRLGTPVKLQFRTS